MSAAAQIARRLVIAGRVQGVGFRYAFADEARMRGLGGWVRNRRDGRVEALVSGPAAEVEALIAWARVGPPAARVASVDVEAAIAVSGPFEIVATL
ncbi:MAG TPA: acylphosphatase [Casimicrobiaceae bacterium]|nr:acylphosphatase [Casimicrobiaceae bacterium]